MAVSFPRRSADGCPAPFSGIYTEIGWNLTDALAVSALRSGLDTAFTAGAGPQESWSLSFFAGVGAHGMAHYLPLDGTVFRDSRSVGSDSFIGAASGGFSVRYGRFAASLSTSFFTETFSNERQGVDFGILNFAWYF